MLTAELLTATGFPALNTAVLSPGSAGEECRERLRLVTAIAARRANTTIFRCVERSAL